MSTKRQALAISWAISGGSLASILHIFFESKEGLFQAIIEQEIDALIKEVDERIDLKISHSLEEFLTKFATIIFFYHLHQEKYLTW